MIHAELWALDDDWHIFWSILRVCHSQPLETETAQIIKYLDPDWEYSVHFVSAVSWLLRSVIMFKFCGSCWNLFNYKQPWLTGVLQLSVVLYKLSAQVKIFLSNSHSDFNQRTSHAGLHSGSSSLPLTLIKIFLTKTLIKRHPIKRSHKMIPWNKSKLSFIETLETTRLEVDRRKMEKD